MNWYSDRNKRLDSCSRRHFYQEKRKHRRKSAAIDCKFNRVFVWLCTLVVFALCRVTEVQGFNAEQIQAPRFTTQPSSAGSIVSEGRTKILQCQALGIPQPNYQWIKDGVPMLDFSVDYFFKIQRSSRLDSGDYQCIAKNDAGSIYSDKIKVTVAYMTKFLPLENSTVIVRLGEAAILPLPPISSVPTASVQWQARDNSLLYGSKFAKTIDHKLVILDVNIGDQKEYRVHATNTQLGQEEVSDYVNLIVANSGEFVPDHIPPTIVVPPADSQAVRGQNELELECIANARPLHELEIIWLKDGVAVETTGIPVVFNDLWNRTLTLLRVDFSHAGEYTCQARLRNAVYPGQSASARVSVLEKPYFVNPLPTETYGEFGKEINLHCPVKGVPKPNVTWYKNTVNVQGMNGYSVDQESGTLTLSYLRAVDGAMYQCWAQNAVGDVNAYTWLRVKTSPPVLIRGPENKTAMEGSDVTLYCESEGAPTPNITWWKNNAEELVSQGRFQILDSGNLLITAVRSRDAGYYTCSRENAAGKIIKSADVMVLTRTQIIQPPADTQVILGHVATLPCKVSSDPALPYDIEWEHDEEPIIPGISSRIVIHLDGTLEISEVRASDVGLYKCIVKSQAGHDERVARLKIIELPYGPTSVVAEKIPAPYPGGNVKVNITWTSGFDGNSPILKYILQKRTVHPESNLPVDLGTTGWETILSNISSDHREVVIDNLKPAASYQFRVSAINAVGEGESSGPSNVISLPQEPPSGPPVGLVGSARSASEIIIQFQPPLEEYRNGQILGYLIRYRLHGYGESPWSYRNITNEAQRNFLIEDLITWKDYEIQIAAYNRKGTGVFSPEIRIKTREGRPSSSPTKVRAVAANSTCIKVSWQPPDPQRINGINQGYKIQAWREEVLVAAKSVPPSPFDPLVEQTGMLCDLDKYTDYNITVLCFTNPGDGKRSPPSLVKTLEDTPDVVANLHFEEISDRSVKVVWKPPTKPNGVLVGYMLRYGVNGNSLKAMNLSSDTSSLKMSDLTASTFYLFEVCAYSRKGLGQCKSATMKSGVKPVLPDPPNSLAVSNIRPFSVVLQFSPGFNGNSSVTKWTVMASSNRNATWHKLYEHLEELGNDFEDDGNNVTVMKSITVLGLTPFVQYRLRLVAHNVVGPSVHSEPTQQFETLQAPPAHPPSNVTIRAMSATQLKIRWIPLQHVKWYGNPRGYNISYRRADIQGDRIREVTVTNPTGNSYILNGLLPYTRYEVIMVAVNDVGTSDFSDPAVQRTRESVPAEGPKILELNATSSTTIVVRWDRIPIEQCNGIVEGYKIYYGSKNVPFQYKLISSNSTFTATLTQLKKFTQYHVQILGYSRVGDGSLSSPPALAQTWDDVPGQPSNISFPDVSTTMARMIWDAPDDPNGVILAYRVTYTPDDDSAPMISQEFSPETRTYRVTELEREKYYWFTITAKTRLGWGETAKLLLFTTNNRELPQAPSAPTISQSQILSNEITFSWTPGRDGFAPIRYYLVEFSEGSAYWQKLARVMQSTYTATNLKPHTPYKFRIQATNDIGSSSFSPPSNITWTLPAAPKGDVTEVTVVPITATSVRVQWHFLAQDHWNGDVETGGYRIKYREATEYPLATVAPSRKEEIHGVNSTSVVLTDLTIDKNYEITVTAFNSRGEGIVSRPVTVYVGEAVPTGEPREVSAEAQSSTDIEVKWKAPLQNQQNGELLGYKIFYKTNTSEEEELEVVPAWCNSHTLLFLEMYSYYTIRMAAFNPAGDGPFSVPIVVQTLQGTPGPVANISFEDITMTSLKLTWEKPLKPNGEIAHYLVTYETSSEQSENGVISKQVRQKVSCCSIIVENLEEETMYSFSVRAKNALLNELSPSVWRNVSTGPQPGSPKSPTNLQLLKRFSAVLLKWTNGGNSPIDGYFVEAKRKDETRWRTIIKSDEGLATEYSLSYQQLLPSTAYHLRLIAYNKYGISYPTHSEDVVYTPSKLYIEYGFLQQSPFYRQTWFLVVIASVSVIFIIALVAYLCVKTKSFKYKHESERSLTETNSIEEGMLYGSSVELRQSQKKISSLKRKNGAPIRPPPRPAPGSITYTDDDSDKAYDNNPDESSLTEKPSEISSSDSQESDTELEEENIAEVREPHSFVNHYANVNDTLKQSWQKQKPIRTPAVPAPTVTYSSHTDSEPEATASLSGQGRIVLNNMARSRAPLPGFSSFI